MTCILLFERVIEERKLVWRVSKRHCGSNILAICVGFGAHRCATVIHHASCIIMLPQYLVSVINDVKKENGCVPPPSFAIFGNDYP